MCFPGFIVHGSNIVLYFNGKGSYSCVLFFFCYFPVKHAKITSYSRIHLRVRVPAEQMPLRWMEMLIVTLIVKAVRDQINTETLLNVTHKTYVVSFKFKEKDLSFLYPKRDSFEKDFHLVDLHLGICGLFSENRTPSAAGH